MKRYIQQLMYPGDETDGFKFQYISYYSLIILASISIFNAFSLTFGEIIRLLCITVGIIWILLKHILNQIEQSYNILLVSFVYMFILSQFNQENDNVWILLSNTMVVVLAFMGICFSKHFFVFSRLDKFMLSIGGFIGFTVFFSQGFVNPIITQNNWIKWLNSFHAVELIIIYFIISRLLKEQYANRISSSGLTFTAIILGVVSIINIWRVAEVFYYSHQAVQNFRKGKYSDTQHYASLLPSTNTDLQFTPLSVEYVIEKLANITKTSEVKSEAYMVIGDIAQQHRFWEVASTFYKDVFDKNPDYPAIHTRLGNVLFEQGYRNQALDLYRRGIGQSEAEDYLALGIALARMGAWTEANQALDSAIERSDLEGIVSWTSAREKFITKRLDELLPQRLLGYIEKISIFEVVQLLQDRGWKVFHPAMQIGSTGISTPVDIVTASSGAYANAPEYILINGQQVSLSKRGHNVAAIDPQTGNIKNIDNFDTWGSIDDALRLAEYVKNIPQGHIVAATINTEGTAHFVPQAKDVLKQMVGVKGDPKHFWSHAFIGVKGASEGSAIEALGENAIALVGVLRANVDKDIIENHQKLEVFLKKAAEEAPGKVAVFIPELDPTAIITIARQ